MSSSSQIEAKFCTNNDGEVKVLKMEMNWTRTVKFASQRESRK